MNARQARQQLRLANERPLAEKIERAKETIAVAAREAGDGMVVSFSGGRDSVALAELAREHRPDVPLVYQDTGLADPKLIEWIKRYGGEHLTYLSPACDAWAMWREKGCVPIGAKTSSRNYQRGNPELRIGPSKCCNELKAQPMNRYLRQLGCKALLVGARGDDSTRHAFKLMWGDVLRSRNGWLLAYPLLTWVQRDTLQFLRERVPGYPLMYARNEELGCRACAINLARWPNQMAKLRRSDPALHRRLMDEAGYAQEILMIRHGLTRRGACQLIDREGLDSLITNGHLDRIPQPRRGLR